MLFGNILGATIAGVTNEIKKAGGNVSSTSTLTEKEAFLNSFKDAVLFIDSNIFMDNKFDILFELLEEIDINIIVLKEQYQELYNIKKNNTDGDSEKGKSVRNAFRTIDHFQEMNKLTIKGLDIESDLSTHADPVFIKEIINLVSESKQVIFFTEDFDLKIRLREQLNQKNLNKELLTIYSFKDIEFLLRGYEQCPKCKKYITPLRDVSEDSYSKYIRRLCPNCDYILSEESEAKEFWDSRFM